MNQAERYLSRSVGKVIKTWREAEGQSVTDLAEGCDPPYNRGYISQIESGKVKQPSDEHLQRLAAGLGLNVMTLVNRWLPGEDRWSDLSYIQSAFNDLLDDSREQVLSTFDKLALSVKKLLSLTDEPEHVTARLKFLGETWTCHLDSVGGGTATFVITMPNGTRVPFVRLREGFPEGSVGYKFIQYYSKPE